MNKTEAKKRIEELRKLTEYHAKKYYDEDSPDISDFEYDMLLLELRNLESKYPEFTDKESLTQKYNKELQAKVESQRKELFAESTKIDAKIGDIETALDAIIAIQESLIGGDV